MKNSDSRHKALWAVWFTFTFINSHAHSFARSKMFTEQETHAMNFARHCAAMHSINCAGYNAASLRLLPIRQKFGEKEVASS